MTTARTWRNLSSRKLFAGTKGARIGRQELMAEILEDTPGALWSRDLIEQCRIERSALPKLKRIVVAIDPAVSAGEQSDETGIIVAGLGVDDHGHIIRDESGKYSPVDWARRAVVLYRKWSADRVIAEANQGGALVKTTVRTVDPNVSPKRVHASKGKITRAEPISALFERRRAHLVGTFPELEDQLHLCRGLDRFAGQARRNDVGADRVDGRRLAQHGIFRVPETRGGAARGGFGRPAERTVRFLAPPGIAPVMRTLSGRLIAIPENRIVELSESEALPLLQFAAGWRLADGEAQVQAPARRSIADVAAAAGGTPV
jgi:Terminase RNaseH-like domain